jgi:hypothetical protein
LLDVIRRLLAFSAIDNVLSAYSLVIDKLADPFPNIAAHTPVESLQLVAYV